MTKIRFATALGLSLALLSVNNAPAAEQTNAKTEQTAAADQWKESRLKRAGKFGEYYKNHIEEFLADNARHEPGGVVFLGDSITERFPLDVAFVGRNVVNRGIGGDRVEGMTDRIDVSVDALAPKKLYLMAGINNILTSKPATVEELAERYQELIDSIQVTNPQTEIIIFSTLPLGKDRATLNPSIAKFNRLLSELAEKEGTGFIDLTSALTDKEGNLRGAYTIDGVHLTLPGYLAWLEAYLTPGEFYETVVSLSDYWLDRCASIIEADAVDPAPGAGYPGGRGPDQLIVYTPKYGQKTTGTNPWGFEAVVEKGVVKSTGGNDSPIPEDGYVISGHGTAAQWIAMNCPEGRRLELKGNTLEVAESPVGQMSAEDQEDYLQRTLLTAIAVLKKSRGREYVDNKLMPLFIEVQALRSSTPPGTKESPETTRKRSAVLKRLQVEIVPLVLREMSEKK